MAKTFPLRIIMLEYFFSIEEYFILLFSIVNEKWRVYWFPFSLTKRALEKTTVWDVSVWWQNIVLSLLTSRTCLLVRHMRLNGKKDDTLCCHPRHKQFFFSNKDLCKIPLKSIHNGCRLKKVLYRFCKTRCVLSSKHIGRGHTIRNDDFYHFCSLQRTLLLPFFLWNLLTGAETPPSCHKDCINHQFGICNSKKGQNVLTFGRKKSTSPSTDLREIVGNLKKLETW